jgi:pyridoxamine 5'-phosphate oxidase
MSLTPEQLAALRLEYTERGLRRKDLDPDPIAQFNHWLEEAMQQDLIEPNAMILATVGADGQPWSRTVLLKVCDARGFTFFTNYQSSKARQLAHNPRAAVTIWWGPLARQVNITGTVSKSSPEESERYFQSRPVASQLGAWASQQSEMLANRSELEHRFEDAKSRFGETNIPLPPHWGGYVLAPQSVEFWQGRRSRLHDRFRYTRQATASWQIDRLSP